MTATMPVTILVACHHQIWSYCAWFVMCTDLIHSISPSTLFHLRFRRSNQKVTEPQRAQGAGGEARKHGTAAHCPAAGCQRAAGEIPGNDIRTHAWARREEITVSAHVAWTQTEFVGRVVLSWFYVVFHNWVYKHFRSYRLIYSPMRGVSKFTKCFLARSSYHRCRNYKVRFFY